VIKPKKMSEEKKKYEISVILKSEDALVEVCGILERNGAVGLVKGAVSRIKLSYPIEKETSAFFSCVVFGLEPEKVFGVRKELKFSRELLRFIIVTPPVVKDEPRERTERRRGPSSSTLAPRKPEDQSVPSVEVLSNEALEKKLEEILK